MTERILNLKSKIIELYLSEKKSTKEISIILEINVKTVRRLLKHFDVEIRGSKKNLLGQLFDRLTVVRYVGNDKFQKCIWECKCKCGNSSNVRGSDLIQQKVKSCGCLLSESSRENIKLSLIKYPKSAGFKGIGDLTGGYISQIKHGALIRNIEYSVSKEYLWDLYLTQNRKCAMTGLNIYFGLFGGGKRWGKRDQTASLDRIDSLKGYVEGNVQWVHKDVNIMKQDFSVGELLNYCKLIVDSHEKNII